MGTIVYENLLNLLLDEKDYSMDEIIKIGEESYGFDPERIRDEISIITTMNEGRILLLDSQRYHKVDEFCDTAQFLDFNEEEAPEGYFEARPGLKKLFEDVREKYG